MSSFAHSHAARRADEIDRFRWAACQLDALSGCLSLGKLRQTLNSLPETLDETYDRILCQIDPLFKREVFHILQWLTCSLRPLALEEVAETVAFDVDSDGRFNVENRLAEPADVLTMCSSLVITIGTNNHFDSYYDGHTSTSRAGVTVRLAHFSVKEYLVSDRIRTGPAASFSIDEEASNARIGATSLSCLLLYDEVLFPSSQEFWLEFPLARYSATFWHKHLSAISETAHLTSLPLATELFLSESKIRNWQALWNLDSYESQFDPILWDFFESCGNRLGSPLYYAVRTGLKGLVEALIELQKDKDGQVGATNESKLKRPDFDGDLATLQYMSKDAYVNATGGVLHTPLQVASWSGRMDIVELLIINGADPNIWDEYRGRSTLSAAAKKGHLAIMKLLLDTGADLYEGIFSETSGGSKEGSIGGGDAKNLPEKELDRHIEHCNVDMQKVARHKKMNSDTVRPSIDTHDRRAMGKYRRTALYEAASSGDAEIVRFILDRDESGVIINLRNNALGETALSRAAGRGHDSGGQILLERGQLVDTTDIHGQTALIAACFAGHESIACKLLDKGADPNSKQGKPMINPFRIGNDGERIYMVSAHESPQYRRWHSIFLSKSPQYPSSPLGAATVANHEPIVRLLIDRGADVNKGSPLPLIEAVERGHKDIARLLVEKGAEVNAVQGSGHKVPDWFKVYLPPDASLL